MDLPVVWCLLYELRAARSTAELELTLAPGSSIPGRSATTAEVRRWPQHNGLAVSDRGRISAEVLEA